MIYVIDTSALMRLYVPDGELPDGLSAAISGAERGNDVLLAPELVLAEAGQVLHKKSLSGLLTREEVAEVAAESSPFPSGSPHIAAAWG